MLHLSTRAASAILRCKPQTNIHLCHRLISTPNADKNQRKPTAEPRPSTLEQNRRLEYARINRLLMNIDRVLASANPAMSVEKYVHGVISSEHLLNPSRYLMFEKTIALLVQYRQFDVALDIYRRMTSVEEILPSPALQTKILYISAPHSASQKEDLLRSLDDIFTQSAFTEPDFRELLDLFIHSNTSIKLIERIVKLYLKSRDPEYSPSGKLIAQLVELYSTKGLMDGSGKWLELQRKGIRYGEKIVIESHPDRTDAYPYAARLSALTELRLSNDGAIEEILDDMRTRGVVPDTAFFNTLITSHIRRGRFEKTFGLYRFLVQLSQASSIKPDAFTFACLFKVLDTLSRPRNMRSRKYKLPPNAITARELYRDMMTFYWATPKGKSRRASIVTPSVLNVALRTFMATRDYAGAFIVLMSFSLLKLPTTLSTYRYLIERLMSRARFESQWRQSPNQELWCDRLLGRAYTSQLASKEKLVERLLSLARIGTIMERAEKLDHDKAASDNPKATSRRYVMPTVSVLLNHESSPNDKSFDCPPLQRILRLAMLADYDTTSDDVSDILLSPSQKFSQAIVDTKKDMLPEHTKQSTGKSQVVKEDRRKFGSKKLLSYRTVQRTAQKKSLPSMLKAN